MERSRGYTYKKPVSPARKTKGKSPEIGEYQNSLSSFGNPTNKIDMGRKYEFKPDNNPAVGSYDADIAKNNTLKRDGLHGRFSPARSPRSPHGSPRRNQEAAPDPG